MNVIIIGGGIGGLTLALALEHRGIACRIYEAAPEVYPLGVGINILPSASRVLCEFGLESALTRAAVLTREAVFFNRFGQHIFANRSGDSQATHRPSSRSTVPTSIACCSGPYGSALVATSHGRVEVLGFRAGQLERHCTFPTCGNRRSAPVPAWRRRDRM